MNKVTLQMVFVRYGCCMMRYRYCLMGYGFGFVRYRYSLMQYGFSFMRYRYCLMGYGFGLMRYRYCMMQYRFGFMQYRYCLMRYGCCMVRYEFGLMRIYSVISSSKNLMRSWIASAQLSSSSLFLTPMPINRILGVRSTSCNSSAPVLNNVS